jgi:hypothetical protein
LLLQILTRRWRYDQIVSPVNCPIVEFFEFVQEEIFFGGHIDDRVDVSRLETEKLRVLRKMTELTTSARSNAS